MSDLIVMARYEPGPSQPYPRVRLSNGRIVREHRWVMEQHLGRPLRSDEHVHHEDEDPLNNALSNLELTTRKEHARKHTKPTPYVMLECPACGESFRRNERYVRSKRQQGQQEFFCSRSCSRKGRFAGKRLNVGNYKCAECGKSFSLAPSQFRLRQKRNRSNGVTCSRKCGRRLSR